MDASPSGECGYLGVDTKIIPNNTPLDELREIDGLVLSGGPLELD